MELTLLLIDVLEVDELERVVDVVVSVGVVPLVVVSLMELTLVDVMDAEVREVLVSDEDVPVMEVDEKVVVVLGAHEQGHRAAVSALSQMTPGSEHQDSSQVDVDSLVVVTVVVMQ
jgi:hypothetical protein